MVETREEIPQFNKKPLIAVLLIGAFVAILNQTLLTTALPHLMTDLEINENEAQWVTTIFMLVNGIMIPITAFLIEKFTARSLFLTAMIMFGLVHLSVLSLHHSVCFSLVGLFKRQVQVS